MDRHFVFVNVGADGHVNPTVALVDELVRRGDRVSYVVNERLAPRLAAVGAEPIGLPFTAPPALDGPVQPDVVIQAVLSEVENTFPVLLDRFDQERPDAVCYDRTALAGMALADKLDAPGIALVPTFARDEHVTPYPQEFTSPSSDPNQPVAEEYLRRVREFQTTYGLSDRLQRALDTPAPLNLVFLPRWFQVAGQSFDERFCFLGPALGPRAGESWQPARPGRPLLFISLGTVFSYQAAFYRMCMQAFADSGWQVAMAVGSHIDPGELGEIPENVEIRAWFPQPAVLRHATVFLSHAGMNSTMESLYHGVPLVTVPQDVEQEANAARVEELGAGRQLARADLTPQLLRETVATVAADNDIGARAAACSTALQRYNGPALGADALENHLA